MNSIFSTFSCWSLNPTNDDKNKGAYVSDDAGINDVVIYGSNEVARFSGMGDQDWTIGPECGRMRGATG